MMILENILVYFKLEIEAESVWSGPPLLSSKVEVVVVVVLVVVVVVV